jgi:hypothetical protein
VAQLGVRVIEPQLGTASAIGYPLAPPGSIDPEAVIGVLMGGPLPEGVTAEAIAVQMQVTSASSGSGYFVAELRAMGHCGPDNATIE